MFVKAIQELAQITELMLDPEGPLFRILDNLLKIMSHVEKIIADIQAGKGSIGGLLQSRAFLDTIFIALDKINLILDDMSRASAKTPETMESVQDNLVTIKKVGEDTLASIATVQNILKQVADSIAIFKETLKNVEKGSRHIPDLSLSVKESIFEIRDSMDNIDKVVKSIQKNFLIRSNLPPDPVGKNIDAGLRPN